MSGTNAQQRVTKTFPVFDCDAHVNDPDEIWRDYVEPAYRELVRRSYWKDEHQAVLNGRTPVIGGAAYDFPGYNPICIAGPQMSKKIARKLQQIGLTPEQKKYVEHPGAYDPMARLREMDLMGIDQVMIIPTMMVANFPFVENVDGAYAFARAYNNWARDYCAAAPDRLFPAGWLPLQDLQYTCEELERIAEIGFRVALIRPIDARGRYPNYIFPSFTGGSPTNTTDNVFRKFEETGIVLGMHTFPAINPEIGAELRQAIPGVPMTSPGELVGRAGEMHLGGRMVDVQTLSFMPEAVQAKLLGANARRMYGIEGTLCVTEEPPPLERPAWFPGGEELERWAEIEADPRAHGITKFDLGKLDPRLLMQALRPY